jgi:murein peptide amidase A
MGFHKELVIGTTVLGRPIEAVHFTPPSYVKKKPAAILFGAIHGDEPVTALMLQRLSEELLERPPGRDTWIIPCLNVDGTMAGSKNNANDVDLNRNFASKNWIAQHQAGYNPGTQPEDQPETRALVELIANIGATRLIAVHATYRVMNWDGTGRELAEQMAAACGYPANGDIGYPTPGSFGSKYGIDAGCEVVTVEVPYLGMDEEAWTETRAAMRLTVDLPT